MNTGASFSVVIVTYDSAHCLSECVATVTAHLPAAELIVVDNCSHDDTLRVARAIHPEPQVVLSPGNRGFGSACNLGARTATRAHILFLNPDVRLVEVDHRACETLLRHPNLGVAAPVIETCNGTFVQNVRTERSWCYDALNRPLSLLRPRELQGIKPFRAEGDWVPGSMFLARRTEFLAVGGFDTRFFMYYEDRELSRRYRKAGFPVRSTSALRFSHAAGASSTSATTVDRVTWSTQGWLQYVAITEGPARARCAASLLFLMLVAIEQCLKRAVRLLRRPRRATRKLVIVRGVLDSLGYTAETGMSSIGGQNQLTEARHALAYSLWRRRCKQ